MLCGRNSALKTLYIYINVWAIRDPTYHRLWASRLRRMVACWSSPCQVGIEQRAQPHSIPVKLDVMPSSSLVVAARCNAMVRSVNLKWPLQQEESQSKLAGLFPPQWASVLIVNLKLSRFFPRCSNLPNKSFTILTTQFRSSLRPALFYLVLVHLRIHPDTNIQTLENEKRP